MILDDACWSSDDSHVWNTTLLFVGWFLLSLHDKSWAIASNQMKMSIFVHFRCQISKLVAVLANFNQTLYLSITRKFIINKHHLQIILTVMKNVVTMCKESIWRQQIFEHKIVIDVLCFCSVKDILGHVRSSKWAMKPLEDKPLVQKNYITKISI
jgi:hypothetical protein